MHSFFTRIFLSIWAVIVLIAAGAVAVTAIDFAAAPDRPATVARAASEVLNRDGLAGLRVWLAEQNRSRPQRRILIIDSTGRDILNQRLPPGLRLRFSGGRGVPDSERRSAPEVAPDSPLNAERPGASDGPRRSSAYSEQRGARRDTGGFFSFFDTPRGRPAPLFLSAPDGARYRVLFDPPPRPGPFSPPFSWWVRTSLVVLALGVSGIISWLLARSISGPVRHLQTAANTLSSGNLDARAGTKVTKRRDELGALGREFDSMAERLSAVIAARQRLLRSISHELRSPLARMEMAIGLARQDPASTPAQLDRVEREAERLDQLIGHILEYARLERDPATFTFEELDLSELVRQILHDAEFESQSPPGRLQLTSDDPLKISAEPNVLHAAIDNVVRNALLHGSPDKPIEASLRRDAKGIHISIRDHGPGVREEDIPRIFEPFYRATEPGTNRVSTEGTGIGLAITQRAAAIHGGSVAAKNAEGGGLIVTITLPPSLAAQ